MGLGFRRTTTLSGALEGVVLAVAAGTIAGASSRTALLGVGVGVGAVTGAAVTWLAIRAPRRGRELCPLPALYEPSIPAPGAAVIPEVPRVDVR